MSILKTNIVFTQFNRQKLSEKQSCQKFIHDQVNAFKTNNACSLKKNRLKSTMKNKSRN